MVPRQGMGGAELMSNMQHKNTKLGQLVLLMIMPDSFTVGECRMPRVIGIKAQELAASCTAGCNGQRACRSCVAGVESEPEGTGWRRLKAWHLPYGQQRSKSKAAVTPDGRRCNPCHMQH